LVATSDTRVYLNNDNANRNAGLTWAQFVAANGCLNLGTIYLDLDGVGLSQGSQQGAREQLYGQ
jgi:hypothetical protein